MTALEHIKQAGSGWGKILSGGSDWRDDFAFTAEGLNTAFLVYFVIAVIVTGVRMTVFGALAPLPMLYTLIGYIIPLVTLIVVTMGARKLLGFATPSIAIIVPGIYLHAAMVLISALLGLAGLNLAGAVTGLTAFLLYRLARVAAELDIVRAIAYALVSVIVLVGLPIALYMGVSSLVPVPAR